MSDSENVDAAALIKRLAKELPEDLRAHVFLAGSLAAAYHHLDDRVVKTKDADLVVHPARDVLSAVQIAEKLLTSGWRRKDDCYAARTAEPANALRAIRLYPPDHNDYFVELLNVPEDNQRASKTWVPVELSDGWYGLPSFEYLAITASERETSEFGIEYAAPCMMALANLLSHAQLGTDRMSAKLGGRSILRSAKDLGRVLALAHLAGRAATEAWLARWERALRACFPDRWEACAARTGQGLRDLLADDTAFEEAWFTCDYGLLNGRGVSMEALRATAERLLVDVIEPLEELGRGGPRED